MTAPTDPLRDLAEQDEAEQLGARAEAIRSRLETQPRIFTEGELVQWAGERYRVSGRTPSAFGPLIRLEALNGGRVEFVEPDAIEREASGAFPRVADAGPPLHFHVAPGFRMDCQIIGSRVAITITADPLQELTL